MLVSMTARKIAILPFKAAKPGEISWPSPFGKGRPGWHIECSVMSKSIWERRLTFTVAGKDLIFPHHSNEIAQSECAHDGAKYVKVWMHNGFVNVEATEDSGEEHVEEITDAEGNVVRVQKMSKSLDNFFSIREVLERFSPEALRWFLLTTHYRAPLSFGPRHLEEAERRVQYLYETTEKLQPTFKILNLERVIHWRKRFPLRKNHLSPSWSLKRQ